MDGWRVRGGLPKHWAPGQRAGDQTAPMPTPQRPYYTPGARAGTRTHCGHPLIHKLIHRHTQKSTGTQLDPALWHWFVFLIPPPRFSSLAPHPLLDSPLAHHRAILQASAEEEGGGGGEWWGHIWKDGDRGRKGGSKRGGGTITWQRTMECLALIPSMLACTQISSCQNQYES